jgi:hypothetical protein
MPVKSFDKPRRKYSSDPSERAKELVAEGRFGGKREGAGRPAKGVTEIQPNHPRPAAAAVRRAASQNADRIAQVFISVLDDETATDAQKVRSMRALLDVEQREVGIELEEAKLNRSSPGPQFAGAEDAAAQLASRIRENPILRSRLLGVLAAGPPPEGNPPQDG